MRVASPSLLALVLAFHTLPTAAQDVKSLPPVCESKTINYITHTLPQQCLRTNWSSANGTEQSVTVTTTAASDTDRVAETAIKSEPVLSTPTKSAESPSETNPSPDKSERQEKKDDGSGDSRGGKDELEDDDDLATGSFMSFEEWKAMMLQKSGQDPVDIKSRKHQEHRDGADTGIHDALDSWGEDGEIALDFDALSGKISQMTATAGAKGTAASGEASNTETRESPAKLDDVAHYRRPKDAGITCKERFSFSSFDVGATVLKTSPGAKNAKAILVENKDSYMLFKCSQENKFVIVELSEDILVDTVVLANFEFFSSMMRNFRVSVSDKYPVKLEKWKEIGTFQARNSRDIQAFLIENPQIWAKYIRIEFLSHYGNEYYCPVSLLRVHGTRMLDSWKEAEAGSEDDEQTDLIEGSEVAMDEQMVQATESSEPAKINATEQDMEPVPDGGIGRVEQSPWFSPFFSEEQLQTCGINPPTPTSHIEASPTAQSEKENSTLGTLQDNTAAGKSTATSSPGVAAQSSSTSASSNSAGSPTEASTLSSSETPATSSGAAVDKVQSAQAAIKPSVVPPKVSQGSKSSNSTSKIPPKAPNNTGQDKIASTASAAYATPTVQESFFKSVSKRLQFLETNTTLSLQYIEDQSKFLQEAFRKMERRQIARVDTFLDNLNNTVLSELRSVQQQYDQIWQSTVLALETQREQNDREIIALSSRLNLLADEVVFQKRMAILQSVLLLCCLVLVLFSRGVLGASSLGEQWQQMSATSQFFHNYLGSPRWPPGSPKAVSPQNTPTHGRRAGLRTTPSLMLNGRRSVSGPAVADAGSRDPPAPSHIATPYADKMLPLTPTSVVFDSSLSSAGSVTPPSSTRTGRAVRSSENHGNGSYKPRSLNGQHSGLRTPDTVLAYDEEDPFNAPSNRSVETLTESDQMSQDGLTTFGPSPPRSQSPCPMSPLQEESYFSRNEHKGFVSNYSAEGGERVTAIDPQQPQTPTLVAANNHHHHHHQISTSPSTPSPPQDIRDDLPAPPLLRAASMPEWMNGSSRKPLPALPEHSI